MPARHQSTIVGIFVLFGIVVLGGLVIAFGGGRTLFADTYDIQVIFPEGMMGVQEGQGVTLNGKRVGETRDIRFVDPGSLEKGVAVRVVVEGFPLPASCEMLVAAPIMGIGKPLLQLVVVNPADTRKLPTDGSARISGRMLRNIDQIIPKDTHETLVTATRHISELAAALKPVAENLGLLLERREMQQVDQHGIVANLATLIQRFDATLRSLNAVIGDEANRANFRDTLANARRISESGVTTMQHAAEISGQGRQLVADTTQLLRQLTGVAEAMSALLTRMDSVAVAMNARTGTVGLLLNDNRLYEEMLLTARRMTKMMDDMREVLDLAKRGQLKIKAF